MTLEDWLQQYGPSANSEAYADYMTTYAFFEGGGVLVKKGLIDIELVEDLFSQRIIWVWETLLQPKINDVRTSTNDPTQYDSIEYLYHEMKHRQRLTARP
jgi:hypothetical protein